MASSEKAVLSQNFILYYSDHLLHLTWISKVTGLLKKMLVWCDLRVRFADNITDKWEQMCTSSPEPESRCNCNLYSTERENLPYQRNAWKVGGKWGVCNIEGISCWVQNPHTTVKPDEGQGPAEGKAVRPGLETASARAAMDNLADSLEDAGKEVKRIEVSHLYYLVFLCTHCSMLCSLFRPFYPSDLLVSSLFIQLLHWDNAMSSPSSLQDFVKSRLHSSRHWLFAEAIVVMSGAPSYSIKQILWFQGAYHSKSLPFYFWWPLFASFTPVVAILAKNEVLILWTIWAAFSASIPGSCIGVLT